MTSRVGAPRLLLATVELVDHCSFTGADAFVALEEVARRFVGRSPALNNLAVELGLRLQCMGYTFQDEHLQGHFERRD